MGLAGVVAHLAACSEAGTPEEQTVEGADAKVARGCRASLMVRGGADDDAGTYAAVGRVELMPAAGGGQTPATGPLAQLVRGPFILAGSILPSLLPPGAVPRPQPSASQSSSTSTSTSTVGTGLPQVLCSGILLCPTAVLTAAHCVSEAAAIGDYRFVPDGIPEADAPRGASVQVGAPGGTTGKLDMAVIRLDRAVNRPLPRFRARMPSASPEDPVEAVIVGYGATSTDPTGQDVGAGRRKVGRMRYEGLNRGTEAISAEMGILRPFDGEGGSNACVGDSGGATYIGSRVAGVTAKIMNLKDGVAQAATSCSEANVTLTATIERAADWLVPAARDACSDGARQLIADLEAAPQDPQTADNAGEDCD